MSQDTRTPGWGRILASIAKMSAVIMLGLFVIGFVWDQIDKHRPGPHIEPLPPIENYKPTAENEAKLHQFVLDVLEFTLLHETGHLVFQQYNVPVGSEDTNESAADSFAATVMMSQVRKGASPQYNGLISAAAFWRALDILQQTEKTSQQAGADEQPGIDFHQQPGRRAVKMACLLFGTNPQAFADLAQQFHIQAERDKCVADAGQTRDAWSSVISLNLDPDAGKMLDVWAPHVAVLYHPVPEGLPNDESSVLSHGQQMAQDLGILDMVGNNLLLLKTPPSLGVQIGQKVLDISKPRTPMRLGDIDMKPVVQDLKPHLEHPANEDIRFAYDYMVIGDSCLNPRNEPEENAYWDPQTHTIKLCYGWVNLVEYVGKRLLAESR
jgi:hypothetical protein